MGPGKSLQLPPPLEFTELHRLPPPLEIGPENRLQLPPPLEFTELHRLPPPPRNLEIEPPFSEPWLRP